MIILINTWAITEEILFLNKNNQLNYGRPEPSNRLFKLDFNNV